MIAHEWKHYVAGGIGIRSLLDIYVYDQKKGASLDRDYIRKELEVMGIAEFEEINRNAAEAYRDADSLGMTMGPTIGMISNIKNRVDTKTPL